MSVTRRQPSPPEIVRVCAAVIRGSRILMVRHEHDGRSYWTLPGGGVEAGETLEGAAIRELAEEAGIAGRVERALFDEPFRSAACRCFLVSIDETEHAVLGFDPEEATRHPGERMLKEVAWHELCEMSHDLQVARVLRHLPDT